jgi:hypothetical protein
MMATARRASGDVATTVAVTIVALTGLRSLADQGTGNTADSSTDKRPAKVVGDGTTNDGPTGSADRGAFFCLRTACHRKRDEDKGNYFFHLFLQYVTFEADAAKLAPAHLQCTFTARIPPTNLAHKFKEKSK